MAFKNKINLLILTLLFVLIIAGCVFFGIFWWYVPSKLKPSLITEINKFWDGNVNVKSAHLDFSGNLQVERLILYDKKWRTWATAQNVEIQLADYPGPKPYPTIITISKMHVTMHTDNHDITAPFIKTKRNGEPIRIRKFDIQKLDLSIKTPVGKEVFASDLYLAVAFGDDKIDFSAVGPKGIKGKADAECSGRFDQSEGRLRYNLEYENQLSRKHIKIMLHLAELPGTFTGEGKVKTIMSADGLLNDRKSLRPKGNIEFINCNIFLNDIIAASQANGDFEFSPDHFESRNISAVIAGGDFEARIFGGPDQSYQMHYQGLAKAVNVSLPKLAEALQSKNKPKKGVMAASLDFTLVPQEKPSLLGNGTLAIDEADVISIPLVSGIFNIAGLKDINPGYLSDVKIDYSIVDELVTIENGEIANSLAAVKVQQGGVVDLQKKYIDCYVIVLPLKNVSGVLNAIPVVNLFSRLSDDLTRLRVKGNWEEPPSKLISKQPVEDIGNATLEFFKNTAESGGEFAEAIINSIISVFNSDEKK